MSKRDINKSNQNDTITTLSCSTAASIISRVAIQPLDMIKIRIQTDVSTIDFKKLKKFMSKIYYRESWRGYFKAWF